MSDLDVVPMPGTVSQMADYLTNGYWAWANYQGTGPRHWTPGQTISVNVSDLNDQELLFANNAIAQFSAVSGLSFAITTGPAQITFNNNGSHVLSTTQTLTGQTLTSAVIDISSDNGPGYRGNDVILSYYLREFGHALGLGNLGQYNYNGTYGVDNVFSNDSRGLSVMSDFSQQVAGTGYSIVAGLQTVDIIALQTLYGTHIGQVNAGNTDYSGYGGPNIFYPVGTPIGYTIYDTDGNDTLYAGDVAGEILDLRSGHWSSLGGGINNIYIQPGTTIENARGGAGNDIFYGNSANNFISGDVGTDTLVFDGPRSAYTFVEQINPNQIFVDREYTVSGNGGGVDTIRQIEWIQFSDITVQDDHPAQRLTQDRPSIDGGVVGTGSIDFVGDRDVFTARPYADMYGKSFTIRVDAASGANPLTDPLLRLYSLDYYANAVFYGQDDNSGVGNNARLIITPTVQMSFYVSVEAAGAIFGNYTVSLETTAFHSQDSWTGAGRGDQGWYVGDFNGDGRDDLMRYVDGVAGAQVLASTGVAFADPVDFTGAGNNGRWWIGDFDGNGRDDALRYNPGVSGAEVLLSSGTSFLLPNSWSGAGYGDQGWVVGDFNGDAADDLLRHTADGKTEVLLSTASGFADPVIWSSYVPGPNGWLVGDFNGDGRDDLLRQSAGGPQVLLSSGNGFNDAVLWSGAGAGDDGWYVGDFNADGKSDLMRYVAGSAGAQIFVSTGTEFIAAGNWSGAGHGEFLWTIGNFDDQAGSDIMRYLPGTSGGEVFVV